MLGQAAYAAEVSQAVEVVQARYQSLSSLSAAFTQHTDVKLLGKTVTQEGSLKLQKPGKMRIEYADGKAYVSDGKFLWVKDPLTKKIDTYKIGGSEIPKEALTFLQGFGHVTEQFAVEAWAPPQKVAGHLYMRLIPIRASTFNALDCDFSSDGLLQAVTIHTNSGNVSRYRFSQILPNPPLEPGLFSK